MKYKDNKKTTGSTVMNTNRKYTVAALALVICGLLFTSCDLIEFGDMNTDPTKISEVDPALLFTTTELAVSGTRYEVWRGNLLYSSAIAQQTVATFFSAGNDYSVNLGWEHAFFLAAYDGGVNGKQASQVKRIETVLHLLRQAKKEGKKVANKLAAARILRVLIYSRITDLYGDIPYFEAGKGAITGNIKPAYDPQKEIYMDFFKQLDEAVKQFNPSQPTFGKHDLIFGGNIAKWKKWANSLRLRFALRVIKAAPDVAKKQAKAALNASGGVMTDNTDIASIPQGSGPRLAAINLNQNPVAAVLAADHEFVAYALVHWMKQHKDPRMAAYFTKNAYGKYKGFPSGYTNTNVEQSFNFNSSLGSFEEQYSRVNLSLADLDDPIFLQTNAEVQFMQAEVRVRWPAVTWPVRKSAEQHYKDGVAAAMKYLSLYSNGGTQTNVIIPQSAITAYLNANPFKTGGTKDQKLEQINTQYWAAVFLNGYEAFANWRRSGYPELDPALVGSPEAPVNSATGTTIPRRLLYPKTQALNLNAKNYKEAIARQGPNKMTTRVWWDAEQ